MNKKAQLELDEINYPALGLAAVGAIIAVITANNMEASGFLKVVIFIVGFVGGYFLASGIGNR